MKKIFFSLLAVAAIASCAKTEEIYTGEQAEIKIKPTAAIATKANVTAAIDGTQYPVAENFDVYAYWSTEPAGSKFTTGTEYLGYEDALAGGVEFTNKGNFWGGKSDVYYWPKNGSLRFAAYSPASVDMAHELATDTYTVTDYVQPNDTDLTWDLLVAPTSASYTSLTAAENVSVVFEHALSWITLKVIAKDASAAKAFDINKVTINNVNTQADFAAMMTDGIQYEEWTDQGVPANYVVFEGNQNVTLESTIIETVDNGTIVIPQPTTSLTVDYTQLALPGTPQLDNQSITVDLVLDGDDTPWHPGKHYVYTLVFGLDEILINPDVVDWEDEIVGDIEIGKTNVYTAEQLAATLTATTESIDVVLHNDIDLPISSLGQPTGGSGEYKLGGENTKAITIDLNGHRLNVTTNYWSGLGAKNEDAVFTIKDGTMTSSQASGTWNSYDLCFANCNYVFEDVVFEKAIALESAGKSFSLKNVSITETHDYYAMWISAKGQKVTIDGLTVESVGRGIKIDEQYVAGPAKVTMNVNNATFKTVKKAAIVVKSVEGAEITLSNVNIDEVAADDKFAVWVDENSAAYADKVVVTGALCKVEGAAVMATEAAAELVSNLKVEGQTVLLIPAEDGESLELGGKISIAKGATLIGLGDEPVGIDNDWGSTTFSNQAHFTNTYVENIFFDDNMVIDAGIANGTVAFKNCIFGGSVAHQGVHFDSGTGVVVFDNCTFVGRNMFGASLEKVVFNNCTFLNKKSSLTGADKWTGVNMWGKYEFNNCVFDTEATCNVKCDGVEAAFNGCSYVDDKDVKTVIRNSSNYSATITFDGAAL